MSLIGSKVLHITFGEGIITEIQDGYITIAFMQNAKKFVYPDAFESFIKAKDKTVELAIKEDIAKSRAEKLRIQKERTGKSEKDERERKLSIEKNTKYTSSLTAKYYARENVAFKCNYCDGGKSEEQIGFNGACSDQLIKNNIVNEKRVWCSSDDCECRQYLYGGIKRKKIGSKVYPWS